MDSLVSIIVPVYNTQSFLQQCLESITNQTYKNLEILCVNDGSTDNSLHILRQYATKDKRIQIIDKPNQGVSAARNTALQSVKGEYLMFVDSDDWIDPNTCELALKCIIKNNCDVVIWSYIREFSNGSLPKQIFQEAHIVFDKNTVLDLHRRMIGLLDKELSHPENADALCTVWGKIYRSNIILQNRIEFVDLKTIGTYEDGLFNVLVFGHVHCAVFINKCLYHYRKDNSLSLTSVYNKNLFEQWNVLFDKMNKYIISSNLHDHYRIALYNRISISILPLGLNLLSSGEKPLETIKKIKAILSHSRYRQAYEFLTLKYFPPHWKTFFFFAKHNLATGLYLLLLIIKIIRNRLR